MLITILGGVCQPSAPDQGDWTRGLAIELPWAVLETTSAKAGFGSASESAPTSFPVLGGLPRAEAPHCFLRCPEVAEPRSTQMGM